MSSNRRKRDRAFDDNGIGVISYRGWLYSGDEEGDRFGQADGTAVIPCRPTPSHALSHPLPDTDTPDFREELARLTDQERTAWSLSRSGFEFELTRVEGVPVGELEAMRRRGFTTVEGTKRTEQIAGKDVEVWDVEGEEAKRQGLTYEQIAERMGVTFRQVKRWVAEARRKLRGER